ncbi:MAG TPA: permease [Aggregicoccus sp.]|nr:permease [Aggregicoccus sp.]
MRPASDLLLTTAERVWLTFTHNWYFLVLGALVAAALKLYVPKDKLSALLQRRRHGSVFAATAVAVATPFCSCGTTAVILGMLASTLPWAPIVAFMVSSPLTSPTELFYSAALFGWPFALTFFGASIVLGLVAGLLAMALERAGLLENQARFTQSAPTALAPPARREEPSGAAVMLRGAPPLAAAAAAGGVLALAVPLEGVRTFLSQVLVELRRLLLFFFGFAFIGYALNALVPAEYVSTLFGAGRAWGVPLAATLGLPLYVNTDASLPLVRSFMDNGASAGATLAFLITGAGTSLGALAGALTIARWRVVSLVVGTLWAGAILIGLGYDRLLAAGLF